MAGSAMHNSLYEGPEIDQVPALMQELAESLNGPCRSVGHRSRCPARSVRTGRWLGLTGASRRPIGREMRCTT